MEVRSWNILEFIKASTQFVIPIYQRNYAWSIKQCEQLWNDIIEAGKHDAIESHFTGSIVYTQQNNSASVGGAWLLIDGQQRLTTLLLLLEAIYRAIDDKEYAGLNKEIIKRNYILDDLAKDEKKYKLLLSDTDKNTLIKLLELKEETIPESEKSINVITNFQLFTKKLNEENIEYICKGLAKLNIVGIALNKHSDNPQLIFESMNSTGKSLSQADLIRNYILMGLEQKEQEELYTECWRPMEKAFGQEAYNDGFDSFMRHYLTVKMLRIPKIGEVYDTFKFYSQTSKKNAHDLLKDMRNHAEYYTYIAYGKQSDNKEFNNSIIPIYENIMQGLKQTVAAPLMLTLNEDYAKGNISITELKDCLEVLESYLLRRLVIGAPTNVLNQLLVELLSKIDKEKYVESFKFFFLKSELYNRKFPNDSEFREQFISREAYRNGSLLKYILSRIENYGRKEKIDISECTIEHVLPQNENMSEEWKAMLGENYLEVWQNNLHRIGNLTITKYNSEYSDKPYPEKLNLVDKNGIRIGLANSAYNLNDYFRSTDIWNESTILERANQLANKALKIWPQPTTSIIIDKIKTPKRISKTTILDLIEVGLLSVGDKIYSTEKLYPGTALLLADGKIMFNNKVYATLSEAGRICKQLVNPDLTNPSGWEFWALKDENGELNTLSYIREIYDEAL